MNRNRIIHARYRHNKSELGDSKFSSTRRLTSEPSYKDVEIESNGGVTIVVLRKEENGEVKLQWGFSKCNETDTYSKKEGISRATVRAENWGLETKDYDYNIVRQYISILIEMIENYRVNYTYRTFKHTPEKLEKELELLTEHSQQTV